MWGGWVSSELEKVRGKTEAAVQQGQERKLAMILGRDSEKGRFRDPAAMMNRG